MRIEVQGKETAKAFVRLEENEPMILSKALTKLIPYVEKNKELGYNSHDRLKVNERELLIDFMDRLESASNHILENE